MAGKENYFHNTNIHSEVGFRWEFFLLQTRYWKILAKVAKFLAGILGKVEGDWNGVTLAARGVDPGTALQQLSSGSISGLSRTKPSEFHSFGRSSLSAPQSMSFRRWSCPIPPRSLESPPQHTPRGTLWFFQHHFPQGPGRGKQLGASLPSSGKGRRGREALLNSGSRGASAEAIVSRGLWRGTPRERERPSGPRRRRSVVQPRRAEAPRAPRPRPGAPALPLAAAARPRSVPGSSAAQLT